MTRNAIGQSVTQLEAPRMLTGQARFTADMDLARQVHAHFLRSPHAHANILGLDKSPARKMPGVLFVASGADSAADGLGDVPSLALNRRRDGSPMYVPPRPALDEHRVRHVGQPVAMVIAETIDQAKDAAEAISVDYAPLPAHISTAAANRAQTPALWEDCPDNESCFVDLGEPAQVDAALAKAASVLSETFTVNRVAACPLEPRAVLADYDAGLDHYTIQACNQRSFTWRELLSKHVFQIPENRMTVICGEVGGSFGMKSGIHPEVPLLAWASRRVGRPVKWVCERSEAFFSDDQARDMVFEAELGLDAEGRFLGARLSANNNMGAFVGMRGFVTPPGIAQSVPGVYATPAVHGQCAAVLSNTVPVSNYRGPGRAAANYVLERIINMAAGDLGLDAAEIRRRNFIQPEAMPYALSVGGIYDCGEFERVMDKCLELGDYPGAAKRKEDAARRDRLLGVGLSMSIDPTSPPSPETAELRFDPGGGATILVGSTTSGQSHETLYVQILSGMLGLEVENIRVIEGDTDRLSWGAGTGAARTATIGGSAVFKAAEKVIEKGRRIAAYLLEAAIGDIEFRDASYSVSGTDRAVSFAAVAEAAFAPAKLPPGEEPGLFETATWSPEVYNFPNACHLCELEIDPETGRVAITRYAAVHDVGVEVNPLLVRGQVHGGIAQGAGQALMENIHYDGQSGQLLSGSLMDYALPRADDFTDFDVASHPVPTETNPLGVKGAGECGTIGALAAVMNALNDALAPLGVRNLAMPATPERVWRAIRDASPTDRQQISVP